ncbi:MAG: TonB family protein [Polyangia bacterium]
MSRWFAAGVSTALVHGGVALLLGVLPAARLHYTVLAPRPIELTVQRRQVERPPAPPVEAVPPPPAAPRTEPIPERPVPPLLQALAASRRAPSAAPGPAGGVEPSAPATAAPARGIDLFARSALCRAVGCATATGPGGAGGGHGTERSAGSEAAARIRGALAQDADAADVRAGRVDPQWRDAEREAKKLFAPPIETVAPDSRPSLIAKQLIRPVTPAPANSKWSAWASNDPALRKRDEITAAQDAYNEPAVGRAVEVEVEIDDEGQIVEARVVLGSGSRRLDAEALRAIERAVRLRTIRDPRGPVIARFALRADLALNLPLATPVVEPNSGQMSALTFGISGTFDEVTGKAEVKVPMKKRLSTRVDLVSVRPKARATDGPGAGAP